MPISEYFGGHGRSVMRGMKEKHGAKKGEQIFYATANKEHQKPAEDVRVTQPLKVKVGQEFFYKGKAYHVKSGYTYPDGALLVKTQEGESILLQGPEREKATDAALQGEEYKVVTRLARELQLPYGEVATEFLKTSGNLKQRYERTREALMNEVQPVTDSSGGIRPGDTVKHTWPDSSQGFGGKKIPAGQWTGTVEACEGPMCKVRRAQFKDVVYVPAEILQKVSGRAMDANYTPETKKKLEIGRIQAELRDLQGELRDTRKDSAMYTAVQGEIAMLKARLKKAQSADVQPVGDAEVNYKYAEPPKPGKPVQSAALRPEEVESVYRPHSQKELGKQFGKDVDPTRPNSMSEKSDHFRVGTPVYHTTGKQGVVHSHSGGKLMVAPNTPGAVPEEWDSRRTFVRAEDGMMSSEREVGYVDGCHITMYPSALRHSTSKGIHGDVYTYVVRTPDGQRQIFNSEEAARKWCKSYVSDADPKPVRVNPSPIPKMIPVSKRKAS